MVKPTSPTCTRPLTSLVFTSSVPRPSTPVDSCGTRGSENARRTTRGHASSSGSNAAVGQTSGSGSKRRRIIWNTLRMVRTMRRIQMLLAQAVVTGVALHAFVAVDGGAFDGRIDVDRAHRADVCAVAASHAFIEGRFSCSYAPRTLYSFAGPAAGRRGSIRLTSSAENRHNPLARRNGEVHPRSVAR